MENELFDGALVQSSRVIYTPSPFARANLIHLQEAGRLQARSPHESRRTGLSSYLCFTVLSGAGELEYDGSSFDLSAGDCVFLDCRRPYLHRTGDRLWQLRWAHFNGPNMAAIYKKYQERGGKPCFTPRDSGAFAALLADLHKIAASEDYLRDMRLNYACKLLVSSHLSVARIAALSGFSDPLHFTKMFKAQYGVTPGGYRLDHAGQENLP